MPVTEAKGGNRIEEDEIEIRLSDIVQFFTNSRKMVLLWGLVFLVAGLLYAFSKPDQYTSQVTVMPEIQSKSGGMGGLGSLAGLAGIDIGGVTGGSTDAVRPDIYPEVLQSVPFGLYLLKQPVYSEELKKEMPLQAFFDEQNNQSWMGKLSGSNEETESPLPDPKNHSKTLQITKKQEILVRQIHSAVSAAYDKKSGILTVDGRNA